MAFPLFLLFFMIPIPRSYTTRSPSSAEVRLASAEWALMTIGIPSAAGGECPRAGRPEAIGRGSLQRHPVAAHAVVSRVGVRLLLREENWMRVLLFVATVPIAIVANASRVTLTGIIAEYKRRWRMVSSTARRLGDLHVALLILALFHQIAERIYKVTSAAK